MFGTSMRVRLQMGHATPVHHDRPKNQRLAAGVAVLMAPFAVLAAVLAVWQIAADMKMASAFLFEDGALSHWAVWAGAAVVLGWASHRLNLYSRPEEPPLETKDSRTAEPGAR